MKFLRPHLKVPQQLYFFQVVVDSTYEGKYNILTFNFEWKSYYNVHNIINIYDKNEAVLDWFGGNVVVVLGGEWQSTGAAKELVMPSEWD